MKKRVNGVTLNYELFGNSGPWVVLSHSLMCDLTMWGPQIDILKNDYRVLSFDTRGHGGSEATEGAYSFDQLALDSKALIDSLEINRPHWLGLSMGGMIGMTYAVNFPDSLASLILCNT
ncbi:alpha/beta hydrolase, partial [Burkholderiales bacterium]|nr:alpha/beta hydrolase [Burkholderiales bacterium]